MTTSQLLTIAAWLPERDLQLLDALHEHRFLTRRHIQTLYFATHPDPRTGEPVTTVTPRAAQRRLQRLRGAGLALRRSLALPDGRRDPEPYYCLTPDGAQLVAHRHSLPSSETRKRAADALTQPLFVRHALAAADLHCALTHAAHTHPGHQCAPEWWRGEHATALVFTHRGERVALNPDGYTRYQARADVHHLLVEIDLGTMGIPRLAEKLDRYRAYASSDAWQTRYPVFPKLLLTTTSESRISSLLDRVDPLPELVLLTTSTTDLERHGPLAPIWRQPGHPQPRPLLEAPQ
jgi:hypothetical protein